MCPAVPTTTDRKACSTASGITSPPSLSLLTLAPAGTLFAARLFVLRSGLAPPRSALAVTHTVENLHQAEVDLALLHVDANDLHLDLVAQSIDLLCILPAQQMGGFDVPIVVIRHRGDMHHAFDIVLDQLHEQ